MLPYIKNKNNGESMSTKSTISFGPNYHFYQEVFDVSNVYLQVEGYEYEIKNDKAMIQIPIGVWKKMLEDWVKNGWSEDQDNKETEIGEKWLESLEELVKMKEEDRKTNEP
jgi:hypothetical protein